MGSPVNVNQGARGESAIREQLSCNARPARSRNCKSCTVCNFVHYLHATHMMGTDGSKVFCVNGL